MIVIFRSADGGWWTVDGFTVAWFAGKGWEFLPFGLFPDKIDGQNEEQEADEMIPFQGLIFKEKQGKYGKHQQGDDLLGYLQLHERKWSAVFSIADSVRRDHEAIFEKCDQPAGQNNAEQTGFLKKFKVLKLQVAVPGKGHKNVGQEQKCDRGNTFHKIDVRAVRFASGLQSQFLKTIVPSNWFSCKNQFNSNQLRMKVLFFSILGGIFLIAACQNRPSSANTPDHPDQISVTTLDKLPAGFLDFYQKFHRDSQYQIAHIQWPLRGETAVMIDSLHRKKELATWEPAQWQIQQPVDFSTGEFKQEWETVGEELVIEHIRYAAANFGLERRFYKRGDGEWELIYYSEMMEMGR